MSSPKEKKIFPHRKFNSSSYFDLKINLQENKQSSSLTPNPSSTIPNILIKKKFYDKSNIKFGINILTNEAENIKFKKNKNYEKSFNKSFLKSNSISNLKIKNRDDISKNKFWKSINKKNNFLLKKTNKSAEHYKFYNQYNGGSTKSKTRDLFNLKEWIKNYVKSNNLNKKRISGSTYSHDYINSRKGNWKERDYFLEDFKINVNCKNNNQDNFIDDYKNFLKQANALKNRKSFEYNMPNLGISQTESGNSGNDRHFWDNSGSGSVSNNKEKSDLNFKMNKHKNKNHNGNDLLTSSDDSFKDLVKNLINIESLSEPKIIISKLKIISRLNKLAVESLFENISHILINLLTIQYGGFIIQSIYIKATSKLKLKIIQIIIDNFDLLIDNKFSSYAINGILECIDLNECEDKIIEYLLSIKQKIINNLKLIKIIDIIIRTFKTSHLKLIYTFIADNFLHLLKIRPGYFLLRSIIKEKKEDYLQYMIINLYSKNHELVKNNQNGCLLSQAIIRNYCLKYEVVNNHNKDNEFSLSEDERINKLIDKIKLVNNKNECKKIERKKSSNNNFKKKKTKFFYKSDDKRLEYKIYYYQNPYLGIFFDNIIEKFLMKDTELTKYEYKILETCIIYGRDYFHDKILSIIYKTNSILSFLFKSIRGIKIICHIIDKFETNRKNIVFNIIQSNFQNQEYNSFMIKKLNDISNLYLRKIKLYEIEEFKIINNNKNTQHIITSNSSQKETNSSSYFRKNKYFDSYGNMSNNQVNVNINNININDYNNYNNLKYSIQSNNSNSNNFKNHNQHNFYGLNENSEGRNY